MLPANQAFSPNASGQETFSVTLKTVGNQTIKVTDATHPSITGASGSIYVTGIPPSISSANSTTFTFGAMGSFTVVAGGTPAPTFSETGALPNGVTLSSSGVLSGTPAAAGNYPITITANNGVSPAASQSFTLTVNKASPTLAVTGPTSVTYGTTGTATISATDPSTGTLSFSAGTSTGCTVSGTTVTVTNASGTCTLTATKLADSNYNLVTSAASPVTLVKANSTTAATFTTTQTVTGTTATLTTKVTPQYAGTPTGTVTYSLDVQGKTTTLGTAAIGTTFTTPVLPAGADTVIAVYNGDNNFNASGVAVYPTGAAPTPVSLSLGSNAVYYPFPAGYTITIPAQSGKALSGTVTVYSGTAVIATISVPSNGVINAFTQLALPVGTYKLQAVYSGNSVYPPGESPVETLSIVPLL